jgi:hypothetical protein
MKTQCHYTLQKPQVILASAVRNPAELGMAFYNNKTEGQEKWCYSPCPVFFLVEPLHSPRFEEASLLTQISAKRSEWRHLMKLASFYSAQALTTPRARGRRNRTAQHNCTF